MLLVYSPQAKEQRTHQKSRVPMMSRKMAPRLGYVSRVLVLVVLAGTGPGVDVLMVRVDSE